MLSYISHFLFSQARPVSLLSLVPEPVVGDVLVAEQHRAASMDRLHVSPAAGVEVVPEQGGAGLGRNGQAEQGEDGRPSWDGVEQGYK